MGLNNQGFRAQGRRGFTAQGYGGTSRPNCSVLGGGGGLRGGGDAAHCSGNGLDQIDD